MRIPLSRRRPSRRHARRAALAVAAALSAALPLLPAPTTASAAQYTLAFVDDFDGSAVDESKWGIYNGGNGGARSRDLAIVSDGRLVLRTTRASGTWKAAGISGARSNSQTYGKYEMRVRFGPGYGVRAVGLLWPTRGGWPPEIDFYEIPGANADRTVNNLTMHYGASASTRRKVHGKYNADFTQWQTVGLEWLPGVLRYTLNGTVMATMSGPDVPSEDMWLGIQTRAGSDLGIGPVSTTPATVDLEVDWVRIYRRS